MICVTTVKSLFLSEEAAKHLTRLMCFSAIRAGIEGENERDDRKGCDRERRKGWKEMKKKEVVKRVIDRTGVKHEAHKKDGEVWKVMDGVIERERVRWVAVGGHTDTLMIMTLRKWKDKRKGEKDE